ncbi:MAG: hypothetical protein JRJ02_11255 [Deltaproteobacteria bacterium]|nr:hypothetical protein [Deltaproteobacteria bacterium]
MLKEAKKKAERIIAESDLADVFGIEMEDHVVFGKKKAKAPVKTSGKKKRSRPIAKKVQAKSVTGKSKKKIASKKAPPKTKSKSPYDTVWGIVRRSRKGVTVARIREKTGFDANEIRSFIYKAKRQGKIKNLKRGVYISS